MPLPDNFLPEFFDHRSLDHLDHAQAFGHQMLGYGGEHKLYTRNDQVAQEGVRVANDHGIQPYYQDVNYGDTVALVLVDMQLDFIYPDGALGVPGAVEDTERLLRWAYRNIDKITHIMASIDTHVPYQIFSPLYWREMRDGSWEMPHPLTMITSQSYMNPHRPLMIPDFDDDETWNIEYIEHLEQNAQKNLMLWTLHCLEGSIGRALHPAVSDLLLFHSAARQTNPTFRPKGTSIATEHYGIFAAEKPVPTEPDTQVDANQLAMLSNFKKIYVAGQAKSHCVFETVRQMIEWGADNAAHMLPKIHILMDATSSVQHPAVDFEGLCQPVYERWANDYGLKLVTTAEDL